MSFIRPGEKQNKRTAFVRKRPQWDDTVNDLDAYRASSEEIRERREAHKSKHHISVKLEKIRKEKQKQRAGLTNVEARQVAILKEVLHDQKQLDNVLSKTDQMLANVKDLFGDDAKQKFTGHPNVTLPPGNRNTSLPKAPEIHTRTEKLSESVMNQSALNDLSDGSEGSDKETEKDDGQRPEPVSFQPQLDLQRFQQFLKEEEENRNGNAVPSASCDVQRFQELQQVLLTKSLLAAQGVKDGNNTLSTISGTLAAAVPSQIGSTLLRGPAHSTQLQAALFVEAFQTPPNSLHTSSSPPTPPKSALNDTGKVKKTKKRVNPTKLEPATNSSVNITDMRQVLNSLLEEIADFEHRTGRRSATDPENSETLTGYTVSLVTAVTKLTHYMKETELRLQAEMMVREHLAQDVRQLTVTIDSLTQEIILTQEEHAKMATEFKNYKQQVESEMAMMQAQMQELKQQQQQSCGVTADKVTSSRINNQDDESFAALPTHVTQASTAILLSPVVRKTRVVDDGLQDLSRAKRQTSLVDIPGLVGENFPPQPPAAATASGSMQSRGDPPCITQSLPVMGSVSVPRPIPLVQTNVAVPITRPHPIGQTHIQQKTLTSSGSNAPPKSALLVTEPMVMHGKNSSTGRDISRVMETQIAELGKQHAEAQQRLQHLLVQQKRQHDQLQHLQEPDMAARGNKIPQAERSAGVSPPISPISHHSEHFAQKQPEQHVVTRSREIRVSVPVVHLEVSSGSLNASL